MICIPRKLVSRLRVSPSKTFPPSRTCVPIRAVDEGPVLRVRDRIFSDPELLDLDGAGRHEPDLAGRYFQPLDVRKAIGAQADPGSRVAEQRKAYSDSGPLLVHCGSQLDASQHLVHLDRAKKAAFELGCVVPELPNHGGSLKRALVRPDM